MEVVCVSNTFLSLYNSLFSQIINISLSTPDSLNINNHFIVYFILPNLYLVLAWAVILRSHQILGLVDLLVRITYTMVNRLSSD